MKPNLPRKKTCWLLCHEWDKWEDFDTVGITYPETPPGKVFETYLVQMRICSKCGAKDFRRVKI